MSSSASFRKSILFYHTGGIGDFVTTLPAVKALRIALPGREFILLGRPSIGALGQNRFYFDTVLNADRAVWACLFSDTEPLPEVQNLLNTIEMAFLWTASEELPARLGRLGIPHVRAQAPFPSAPRHVVDYHIEFIEDLVQENFGSTPALYLSDEDRRAAGLSIASGSILLHPGSGSASKNWPLKGFLEIAALLKSDGWRVAWVTGPTEDDRNLGKELPGPILSNMELPVLAAALSACRLFMGNDSGVTHLAAATGAPVIALFGPSDPQIWAPRGAHVRLIRHETGNMLGITAAEVFTAAREILSGILAHSPRF